MGPEMSALVMKIQASALGGADIVGEEAPGLMGKDLNQKIEVGVRNTSLLPVAS